MQVWSNVTGTTLNEDSALHNLKVLNKSQSAYPLSLSCFHLAGDTNWHNVGLKALRIPSLLNDVNERLLLWDWMCCCCFSCVCLMLGIVCLFVLGCSCQVTLGEKKAYLHLNLPTNMFKDGLTLITSTILNASLLTGYVPKAGGCNKPQIKKPNIQSYSLQLLFSCHPPKPPSP